MHIAQSVVRGQTPLQFVSNYGGIALNDLVNWEYFDISKKEKAYWPMWPSQEENEIFSGNVLKYFQEESQPVPEGQCEQLPGPAEPQHPRQEEIYPGFALIGRAPILLRSYWSRVS